MIQLKSKSQTIVVISVVGLLVSILLVILVLVPQFSRLKDLSDTANAKQEQLRLGKQQVQSIKEGVNLINNSSQIISSLGVAMPASPSSESALLQLSSAAASSGVAISSASINDASKGQLQIAFSVTGPYAKVTDFISKVETNLRPVQFSDITMNSTDATADLSATFDLVFPYIEPEASVTASPTPQAASSATSDQNGGTT